MILGSSASPGNLLDVQIWGSESSPTQGGSPPPSVIWIALLVPVTHTEACKPPELPIALMNTDTNVNRCECSRPLIQHGCHFWESILRAVPLLLGSSVSNILMNGTNIILQRSLLSCLKHLYFTPTAFLAAFHIFLIFLKSNQRKVIGAKVTQGNGEVWNQTGLDCLSLLATKLRGITSPLSPTFSICKLEMIILYLINE